MNGLKEMLAETGGDFFAVVFYALAFSLTALCSFVALMNNIRLEVMARKGFGHRALLLQSFYAAYDKRKKGVEEAERLGREMMAEEKP